MWSHGDTFNVVQQRKISREHLPVLEGNSEVYLGDRWRLVTIECNLRIEIPSAQPNPRCHVLCTLTM